MSGHGCPAEDADKRHRADDIAFAREIDQRSVPNWSHAWGRIGELQRAGLVRVRPVNRWVAEISATGAAARQDPDTLESAEGQKPSNDGLE